MSEALILRFIQSARSSGGLVFFHPQLKPDKTHGALWLFAMAKQSAPQLDQCETIPDTDALAQGVVTTETARNAGTRPKRVRTGKQR